MSKMPCPSDFRFGDSSNPDSPDYDGQEPQYILIPHDFVDGDQNSRRGELAVEFYVEGDGQDGVDITDASVVGITLSNVTLSIKQAQEEFGDLPEGSELAGLVTLARSWEKRGLLDLNLRDKDGNPEYAKIQIVYLACPPDPSLGSESKVDIRNIEFGESVEIAKFKFVPLKEFMGSHPDFVLPVDEDLKVLVEAVHHEIYASSDKLAPKRNVFRP